MGRKMIAFMAYSAKLYGYSIHSCYKTQQIR
jgi:hypothetical protein